MSDVSLHRQLSATEELGKLLNRLEILCNIAILREPKLDVRSERTRIQIANNIGHLKQYQTLLLATLNVPSREQRAVVLQNAKEYLLDELTESAKRTTNLWSVWRKMRSGIIDKILEENDPRYQQIHREFLSLAEGVVDVRPGLAVHADLDRSSRLLATLPLPVYQLLIAQFNQRFRSFCEATELEYSSTKGTVEGDCNKAAFWIREDQWFQVASKLGQFLLEIPKISDFFKTRRVSCKASLTYGQFCPITGDLSYDPSTAFLAAARLIARAKRNEILVENRLVTGWPAPVKLPKPHKYEDKNGTVWEYVRVRPQLLEEIKVKKPRKKQIH